MLTNKYSVLNNNLSNGRKDCAPLKKINNFQGVSELGVKNLTSGTS